MRLNLVFALICALGAALFFALIPSVQPAWGMTRYQGQLMFAALGLVGAFEAALFLWMARQCAG